MPLMPIPVFLLCVLHMQVFQALALQKLNTLLCRCTLFS